MSHNVSTLDWLNGWYHNNPPRMACEPDDEADFRRWKSKARRKLRELLGIYRLRAEENIVLEAEVVDRFEQEKFSAEKILIRTQREIFVPCWVLVPKCSSQPHPSILCLHGHDMSKDVVIGKPRNENERVTVEQTKGDYGRRFVEAGYLCLCPDVRGFGERDENIGCDHLYRNAVAVGLHLGGLRVWDHLKCLEYLLKRSDVDSKRVGVVGLSMGAEHAMYVSALEKRIGLTVSSCIVRELRKEFRAFSHCICSYIPRLFDFFDFPDICGMIAPRPLMIQQGTSDTIPMNLVHSAVDKIQRAYSLLDADDRFGTDYFAGGHEFSFNSVLGWANQWFRPEVMP